MDALKVLRGPLAITLLLSTLMFVPLSIDSLRLNGSSFDAFTRSPAHFSFLSNAACATVPLLIDILLDLFSTQRAEYLAFRLTSLLSLALSLAVMLASFGRDDAAEYILTFFVWGYFIEFGVIFAFMHFLIPEYFTWPRTVLVIALIFVFLYTMLLNSMQLTSVHTLNALFLTAFYCTIAVCASISTIWALHMWRAFQQQSKPLLRWLAGLSSVEACTMVFMTGLASQAVLYFVMLNALSSEFSFVANLRPVEVWIVESSRTFLCVFTYMLPSRLFRAELLGAQKQLEAKVEIVK
jgi:hypothetical protein